MPNSDPTAAVDCRATNDVAGPFSCESEGNGGLFGGTDDEDDSGILRFVRSEYAGLEIIRPKVTDQTEHKGLGRPYVQIDDMMFPVEEQVGIRSAQPTSPC